MSQKGKRGHGDGGDEGGSHLDPDDLMGLTVSQHVSLRVSVVKLQDLIAPYLLYLPSAAFDYLVCLQIPAAVVEYVKA